MSLSSLARSHLAIQLARTAALAAAVFAGGTIVYNVPSLALLAQAHCLADAAGALGNIQWPVGGIVISTAVACFLRLHLYSRSHGTRDA